MLLVLTVLNLEVGSNRSWYYTVESSKAAMPEFMSVTLRPVPPKMPPPPGLVERIMWERSVSRVSQALGDSSDSGGRLPCGCCWVALPLGVDVVGWLCPLVLKMPVLLQV